MFLRSKTRTKNGKLHRYWSIVENRRVAGGKVLQRHVLYLGEISGSQQEAWQRGIEVFEDGAQRPKTVALLPAESFDCVECQPPCHGQAAPVVHIRLAELALRRPRQWGACWLGCQLYEQLGLDTFFAQHLPASRKGTRWNLILQTLCLYRLIDPGSEWRLHRQWFERTALSDLLGADLALVEPHIRLPAAREAVSPASFSFAINREKLRGPTARRPLSLAQQPHRARADARQAVGTLHSTHPGGGSV